MKSSDAGPSRPRALEPLRLSTARSTTKRIINESNASKAFIPLRPTIRADQSSIRDGLQSNRNATQSQHTQMKALEPLRVSNANQYSIDVQKPTARRALEPIGGRRRNTDQSNSLSDDATWSRSSGETNSRPQKKAFEPIRPTQNIPHSRDKQKLGATEITQTKKRPKALEPIKLQSADVSSEKKIALDKVREPIKSSTNITSQTEIEEPKERQTNKKAMIPLKSRPRVNIEGEVNSEADNNQIKCMLPLRSRSAVEIEENKTNDIKSKAFEPLQRSGKQSMDQLCAGSRAYAALDHARHALKIMCYDLQRMRSCLNKNGISLGTYSHLKRETVFVHIVGRIVGVEEKDRKVKWLIDDGSAVIAAHHAYDPRPVVIQQNIEKKVDKGKRRAVEEPFGNPSGIPSEYIRPPTPIKAPKRESKIDAILRASSNNKKFEHTYRHLSVCTLVSVVGRVDSWFKGEMIIQVDRIVPPGVSKDETTIRAPREGYIELLNNPNMESDHILETAFLAVTEYANDAEPPKESSDLMKRKGSDGEKIESAEKHDEANRVYHLKRKSKEAGTESETREKANSGQASIDVEATVSVSEQGAQQRRMRDFRKIPDRQINDQLLRIYVQKHISDYCRPSHRAEEQQSDAQPPAFTINYLQRVTNLRLLADRVVDVAVKKREAKRRKIESDNSISHLPRDDGKRQRLFESVIRNIVADGMVVVSDSRKQSPIPPFDGLKPKDYVKFSNSEQGKLLDWEEVKNEKSVCKFAPTIVSGDFVTAKQMQTDEDTSMMRWRGSNKGAQNKEQEAYQLVTPSLLADPLREVVRIYSAETGYKISETFESLPAYKIKERMRLLDDRWQFIRPESVAESIVYLRAQL
jgi:hypothetical protein